MRSDARLGKQKTNLGEERETQGVLVEAIAVTIGSLLERCLLTATPSSEIDHRRRFYGSADTVPPRDVKFKFDHACTEMALSCSEGREG
jgi:hypothetical protein